MINPCPTCDVDGSYCGWREMTIGDKTFSFPYIHKERLMKVKFSGDNGKVTIEEESE